MERQKGIDEISGLLIIEMILMHCFHNANMIHSRIYCITYPLSFFMPWFFYKSGMFFRHRSLHEVATKEFRKLLIPFCLFSCCGLIVHTIRKWSQENFNWETYISSQFDSFVNDFSFYGNLPLWFLFVLYMVKLIYNIIYDKMNAYLLGILCFVTFNMLHYSGVKSPFYFASIFSGLFFYLLGHRLQKVQYHHKVLVFAVVVYLLSAALGWNVVDMHWNKCNVGYYFLWVPTSLAGIILINNIFKIKNVNIGILECIGRNSMALLVSHWIVIEIGLLIFKDFAEIDNLKVIFMYLVILEMVLLPIITILLTSKRMSWMIGR